VLAPQFWTGRTERPAPGLDVACTKIAVDFQNLQRSNADECIKQSLAILREATSADGAFSAFLGASGSHIESVMVAGGQFAPLHPEGLRGMTLERLPYLAARTEHLRLSEFRDTAAPRRDQHADANLLAELSIGAALLVAFRIRGKPAGFLGLLFGLPRATFDVNLQLLLKLLGSSLALGLERVRLSLTLDQLEARSLLGELAANDGLWDFDVEAQETYFSPRWRAMLGYDTVELHRNFDWRTLVHVEDAQRVQNAIRDHVAGKTPMFESVHRMHHRNGEWRWVQSRAKATVDPHGRTMSTGVVPDVTQTWLGPDGTGRTVTKAGATEPKGTKKLGSHDGVAEAQGAPAAHVPPVRLAGLSTNPTVLARQLAALARAADNATKPSSQPTYNEIQAIWAQQPVPPKLQAAFLRVLATIPNLRDLGSTTDRVGRPGRAVGFDTTSDGAVTRQIIILDPSTGAPLGEEQILLSDPHHMSQWSVIPIHVPAVVDYTAYLASAHVPTVHSTS